MVATMFDRDFPQLQMLLVLMFELDVLEPSTCSRAVQHVVTRCCVQKPASCSAHILSSHGPLPLQGICKARDAVGCYEV